MKFKKWNFLKRSKNNIKWLLENPKISIIQKKWTIKEGHYGGENVNYNII